MKPYFVIKRGLDILIASVMLILLAPVFLSISIAIRAESKGSAIFKQKRVTKNGRIFEIYKFRTMYQDAPNNIPTDQLAGAKGYITKVGSFLRKTSLDELPQLVNIIKGEMSIVGPRPALPNQIQLLETRKKLGADQVLVGLTGLAQINGRDTLEDIQKAMLDGTYANHISFKMDSSILIKTIKNVLTSDGIVEGVRKDG